LAGSGKGRRAPIREGKKHLLLTREKRGEKKITSLFSFWGGGGRVLFFYLEKGRVESFVFLLRGEEGRKTPFAAST